MNRSSHDHDTGSSHSEPVATDCRRIAILGATGSIGTATIDVLQCLNQVDSEVSWQLWSASGHRRVERLVELVRGCDPAPTQLIISDPDCDHQAAVESAIPLAIGPDALIAAAVDEQVDTVVAAIVGRAGVESTLAAIDAGKRIALANKETLVVAGPIVQQRMDDNEEAELLPVDSEHSAIFQCIESAYASPHKIILTASGGPFRNWTLEQMRDASPDSALVHPTWQMGRKITIDSATMMNKALEIIEARWLFGVSAAQIEVVVHPQSIVHSMVEFDDGSVTAQMSPPDMRLPIQYALTYPYRLPCPAPALDRSQNWELTFQPADPARFPALQLGFEVADAGGTAGAVLNAANEEAVGLFLAGQIRFTDIVTGCRDVLENHHFEPQPTLQQLLKLDLWSRDQLRQRFKIN
jgi:1-deoxy-D-xylulose-5-phosphate reductoisomerase